MEKKLEFYVLNYNINEKKAEMWNIFNNVKVRERVEAKVKEYLKDPNNYSYEDIWGKDKKKGYEAIKQDIDRAIMSEEWSRCEYEIGVGTIFDEKGESFEKWDCYSQAHANIGLITDMCIRFFGGEK